MKTILALLLLALPLGCGNTEPMFRITCGADGESCSTYKGCCIKTTCIDGTCVADKRDQLEGAACVNDGECSKGICNGSWCSAPCADDPACGKQARCMLTKQESYRCFPNCTGDAECKAIGGPGVTCQSGPSRDGAEVNVCSE